MKCLRIDAFFLIKDKVVMGEGQEATGHINTKSHQPISDQTGKFYITSHLTIKYLEVVKAGIIIHIL